MASMALHISAPSWAECAARQQCAFWHTLATLLGGASRQLLCSILLASERHRVLLNRASGTACRSSGQPSSQEVTPLRVPLALPTLCS